MWGCKVVGECVDRELTAGEGGVRTLEVNFFLLLLCSNHILDNNTGSLILATNCIIVPKRLLRTLSRILHRTTPKTAAPVRVHVKTALAVSSHFQMLLPARCSFTEAHKCGFQYLHNRISFVRCCFDQTP